MSAATPPLRSHRMTLAWEARTLFVTTDTVIEPQKEKKSKHKREKKSRHKRDAEGERSIITGKRIKRSAGDVADAEGELRRQALLAPPDAACAAVPWWAQSVRLLPRSGGCLVTVAHGCPAGAPPGLVRRWARRARVAT